MGCNGGCEIDNWTMPDLVKVVSKFKEKTDVVLEQKEIEKHYDVIGL